MAITLTAFAEAPDQGRGLARDMPIRWALEEVGQPYQMRLVTFDEMKGAAHLARQPFGQIPTYEEEGLTLFETGAILLHIAEHHAGLLSLDPVARARARVWVHAAQATLEPPITEREAAGHAERDKPWFAARQPLMAARIERRLGQLADHLGDADWLEGEFSLGDLAVVTVLRRLQGDALLARFPALMRYVARAEARPAFARAFTAQLAVWQAVAARQP